MPDEAMLQGALVGSPARIREQWEAGGVVAPGATGVIVARPDDAARAGADRRRSWGFAMPDVPGSDDWKGTLADLDDRRSDRPVDGRRGAAGQAPRRRESSTPAPASTPCSTRVRSTSSARSPAASDAPADAIVLGSGRIGGRPVMVAAEDFTVLAGTISHTQQLEALPRRRARGDRPRPAGDDARRRRLPRRRQGLRPHPHRHAGAGTLLGSRPAGHRGARCRRPGTAHWWRRSPTSR